MAQNTLNLNFNLRDPQKDVPVSKQKETPINLIVRYNNQKFTYPTSERILPKYWQGDKNKKAHQRAIQSPSFPSYPEFNTRLDNIENTVQDIFRRYKNDNDNALPTWSKFKDLLDAAFKRSNAPVKGLIPFIKQFIEEAKTSTNPKSGTKFSNHTVKKYKTTLNHLEAYITKSKRRLDFDDIDLAFRDSYMQFLREEYDLSTNSIGKDIAVVKKFLNVATSKGINKSTNYKNSGFTTISEKSDSIYLTKDELQSILDLDLTANKTLDTVRDLFLIGCYTGLRYSDFSRLSSEHIVDGFITIETFKTKETVVIPVHGVVKAILDKYSNHLPRCFSNQKTNQYLKDIGKKIDELDVTITKKITKGGTRKNLQLKKWQLITTHTARRSFATNLFLEKFPPINIMKITGHRTESAFMRYIKITPTNNAVSLQKHWENL